jgi:hypothetical protein
MSKNGPEKYTVVEVKVPQSKTKKDGTFLRQTLDESHVVKQTGGGVRRAYGSSPKMGRE